MMNEPEKSDPSTVAAKPANKTGRSDAEAGERREGCGPRRTSHGPTQAPDTERGTRVSPRACAVCEK